MNRLGIQSLNAGAPDLRLSGDQTQRGTYTQRRRNQMAYGGIAGLDGRKRYGIGSWFQEKIKDPIKEKFVDPAIDFVTENPLLTAGGIGLGINQFGIPGMDKAGQGWIGDLLGGAGNMLSTGARNVGTTLGIPGADQWFTGGISGMDDAGLGVVIDKDTGLPRQDNWQNLLTQQVLGGQLSAANLPESLRGIVGSQIAQKYPGLNLQTPSQRQEISWKLPLAIGTGAGAYQKKYLEDQPKFGEDTTGIRFQTAQEAMADPTLRFKPEAQYANVAEGGRIGYKDGTETVQPRFSAEDNFRMDMRRNLIKKLRKQYPDATTDKLYEMMKEQYGLERSAGIQGVAHGGRIGLKKGKRPWDVLWSNILDEEWDIGAGDMPSILRHLKAAKDGGRIGAQEGGLMNLGGMEKDYRQEGGFVPLGGEEKADDVPARLSKNEFVFIADAVRAAGGGDIDAGAEVMENVMKNLEAGGEVSEDSQGLEGAQDMFANAQELEKRII